MSYFGFCDMGNSGGFDVNYPTDYGNYDVITAPSFDYYEL